MQQLAGINEIKINNPYQKFNIKDKVYAFNDLKQHIITDIAPDIYSINKVDSYSNPDLNDYNEEDINNIWYKLEDTFWYPQSRLSNNINLHNDINEI